MSQAKEAQIKLYKTREDKELDKVIALENKVKVLNDIVYKTGQSVQTMNMLNRNCKTSFAKPEFLKKAQRANPRLYDTRSCYNDNLLLYSLAKKDFSKSKPVATQNVYNDFSKPVTAQILPQNRFSWQICIPFSQDSTFYLSDLLMAKATSFQAWLWHRRLSHLNSTPSIAFKENNIVTMAFPKLKFIQSYLCLFL
ncbi:hypothetical protein Tco_1312687 [Tanacetum coccineum]